MEKTWLLQPRKGAPCFMVGQAVTCTNRNTSEFTYGVHYPIERVLGRCNSGGALALVRNNNWELRVVTGLAWNLGHWKSVPCSLVIEMKV